jgi:nitric oxide reductase subunit C
MPGTRTFFIACCTLSLILLVWLASGALQSHDITPEVAAGLEVWRSYGCEGCHTLVGQGGSYAPDLTHIYSQRSDTYIREFLVNPNAFHPNQRLMPRFLLTRTNTDNLMAFLSWIDTQVTAWPPRPINVSGGGNISVGVLSELQDGIVSDDPVERGRALFSRAPANCATCHSIEPDVVNVGPSLAGIATRAASRISGLSAEEYIRNSMVNPSDYVVEGFPDVMAKNLALVLSSQDIADLVAYLMTLA